ncbi:MAG TPA: hypothetical protein VFY93_09265 [Planctomycetota bacterium]|nr:hypothetical protein [Planctomycetota bacterium]
MQTVEQLLRTLQKVQALRARAGTPGEQRAAAEAEERILARLHATGGGRFAARPEPGRQERAILHRFSIRDPWTRKLFFALLERDGYHALRYPRQQAHTVRVRAPEAAMDRLWREFRGISARLRRELEEVTDRVIRTDLFAEDARAARQGP